MTLGNWNDPNPPTHQLEQTEQEKKLDDQNLKRDVSRSVF